MHITWLQIQCKCDNKCDLKRGLRKLVYSVCLPNYVPSLRFVNLGDPVGLLITFILRCLSTINVGLQVLIILVCCQAKWLLNPGILVNFLTFLCLDFLFLPTCLSSTLHNIINWNIQQQSSLSNVPIRHT